MFSFNRILASATVVLVASSLTACSASDDKTNSGSSNPVQAIVQPSLNSGDNPYSVKKDAPFDYILGTGSTNPHGYKVSTLIESATSSDDEEMKPGTIGFAIGKPGEMIDPNPQETQIQGRVVVFDTMVSDFNMSNFSKEIAEAKAEMATITKADPSCTFTKEANETLVSDLGTWTHLGFYVNCGPSADNPDGIQAFSGAFFNEKIGVAVRYDKPSYLVDGDKIEGMYTNTQNAARAIADGITQ